MTRGYTHTTLGAIRSALSLRLSDPANVYWSAAELNLHIIEAIRTWQSYTSHYRDRVPLPLTTQTLFYDLTALLPPATFGFNITDLQIASGVLYHLLEPQLVSGTWAGTDQFNLPQLQNAIEQRTTRFLGDSGAVNSYLLLSAGAADRVPLPDTLLDVRRAAWLDLATGVRSLLWREDEHSLSSFAPSWRAPGTPQAFSLAVQPPRSLQLAPRAANPGQIETLAVLSGPALQIATGATPLPLPDDLSWGLKFGALADLLSADGQGRDPERAAYCEQRYQESVQIGRAMPSVVQMWVEERLVWSGSVFDLDAFSAGWHNALPDLPGYAGMAGRNMLAMQQVPEPMTATLDLVRNIPVPVADGDFVQVPKDVVNVAIDYAQHLASFKMGGEEFAQTMSLYKNFVAVAGEYNGRLRQLAFYNDTLRAPAIVHGAQVPRIDLQKVTTV